MSDGVKVITKNRKARHEYHIEEVYEAGIVLTGTEVKSIRAGRVNLKDSFALVEDGEVYLRNMHIAAYKQGNRYNHDPERRRKLLLHKREIRKFIGKTKEKGYTLVPLQLYFKKQLVKVKLALAKGKNLHDKRHDIKKKTAQREMERAFKDNQLGRY
ncbi:SsrA-binding protein SmpB [Natroniella sulfidigena]|uniref:SsrA-binding protein SmpB n=1 Tax=Natroniella sulfidigena TaxID=723921 RepID=UPI00200A2CDC|nr:SsrA-binding protein SmpB [Natroniella sulfidigena]MCK8817180.1 SsrA-binding protein SmpB [Natroniella sulfidigena]